MVNKDSKNNTFLRRKSNLLINSLAFMCYLIVLVLLFSALINLNIIDNNEQKIYSVDELEHIADTKYDCILILGAGVRKDGSPTPMLMDRLIAGYNAFLQDTSSIILLSGDSENADYRETVAMKNALIEMGVPEQNILCDGYGLSTYESIWRASNVYHYNKIIIISQKYHLYRALYIANELGMTAIGVDGALQGYSKQPIYSTREYLARLKDVFYTELNSGPKYVEFWEESNE